MQVFHILGDNAKQQTPRKKGAWPLVILWTQEFPSFVFQPAAENGAVCFSLDWVKRGFLEKKGKTLYLP